MFYHVSIKDHGPKFKFIPRNPALAYTDKEGNIPRVCVTPDVFYCLRSMVGLKRLFSFDIILKCRNETEHGFHGFNNPAIYVTDKIPHLPPRVADFRKNKEYWFIKPITMKRLGYVDLVELTKGKVEIITEQKEIPLGVFSIPGKDVVILERRNTKLNSHDLYALKKECIYHHDL